MNPNFHRRTCLNPFCGTRTSHRTQRCPRCGRAAFDDAEIARRGGHVMTLGAILTVAITATAWMIGGAILMAANGKPPPGIGADAIEARLVLAGLGSLFLMGHAFMVSGFGMIAGRSSRWSTLTGIALFGTALVTIGLFMARFGAG